MPRYNPVTSAGELSSYLGALISLVPVPFPDICGSGGKDKAPEVQILTPATLLPLVT